MSNLNAEQIAQVSIACAQYASRDDNDDERIGSIVANQLSHLPRALVYCQAVATLKRSRSIWCKQFKDAKFKRG